MKRRIAVTLALVLLLGITIVVISKNRGADPSGHATGPGVPLPKSNVLLIIGDDIGVDKVGVYADDAHGDYRSEAEFLPDTPVLDQLAAKGVRFTDAWANPTCSPSRATLYTGNHGFRTGVGTAIRAEGTAELDPSLTHIAEVMAGAGYPTGLFGKWHQGANDPPAEWEEGDAWSDHIGQTYAHEVHPITHGFDTFKGTIIGGLGDEGFDGSYTDWMFLHASRCEDCEDEHTVTAERREDYVTSVTVEYALDWIDVQDSAWFAVVALHAPHTPHEIPPASCSYRPDGADEPQQEPGIYEEMVECMDRSIGDLLDGIEDLDDTLVIFIGDNGTHADVSEHVFDDGRGKNTLYESGVRVPLIVVDGRELVAEQEDFTASQDWHRSRTYVVEAGAELAEPVHAVDLFATIAQVAEADSATGVDSVSFLPLLAYDTEGARKTVYTESFSTNGTGTLALRRDNWKLMIGVAAGSGDPCRESYQLYDLYQDRFEENDLSEEKSKIIDQMKSAVDKLAMSADDAWYDVPDC